MEKFDRNNPVLRQMRAQMTEAVADPQLASDALASIAGLAERAMIDADKLQTKLRPTLAGLSDSIEDAEHSGVRMQKVPRAFAAFDAAANKVAGPLEDMVRALREIRDSAKDAAHQL